MHVTLLIYSTQSIPGNHSTDIPVFWQPNIPFCLCHSCSYAGSVWAGSIVVSVRTQQHITLTSSCLVWTSIMKYRPHFVYRTQCLHTGKYELQQPVLQAKVSSNRFTAHYSRLASSKLKVSLHFYKCRRAARAWYVMWQTLRFISSTVLVMSIEMNLPLPSLRYSVSQT